MRIAGAIRDISANRTRTVRPNARMNVSRYTASGSTQSSGIGTRLRVMCDVTASMSADGTNAAMSQYARSVRVGGAVAVASAVHVRARVFQRPEVTARTRISKAPKPADHHRL